MYLNMKGKHDFKNINQELFKTIWIALFILQQFWLKKDFIGVMSYCLDTKANPKATPLNTFGIFSF